MRHGERATARLSIDPYKPISATGRGYWLFWLQGSCPAAARTIVYLLWMTKKTDKTVTFLILFLNFADIVIVSQYIVMTERYINPHTDFGFKRLFGSEFNKELLISFLNALFRGEQDVKDVTYLNSEQLGDRADARRAIFDVYCENQKGEKFIVEMQNVYQEFFKDRTIYYSTFPIREQAQRGGVL